MSHDMQDIARPGRVGPACWRASIAPRRVALVAAGLAILLCGAAGLAAERPLPRSAQAVPGEICGSPALLGAQVAPIRGEGVCGVAEPVRIDAVGGVALDPPPSVTCGTARALAAWVEADAKPAFARRGAALAGLEVIDAYSCRNRNREDEADLSEHSFGRALDISAFRLRGGESVTVREGWTDPAWSATLRGLHAAACGPFGTVLGPEANALHADHLHLDVEARRSGPYCR